MNKTLFIIILLFVSLLPSCKDNRTSYQKANDFFKAQKYKKAIFYFDSSLKDGIKNNSNLYEKLGLSYWKIKHFREGENYIKKALKISPDNEDLKYIYIDILIKIKRYYKASTMLKNLPDSFNKYFMLSNVYFLGNSIKDSLNYLNKALKYISNDEKKIKLRYEFAKKLFLKKNICIEKNKIFNKLYPKLKNNLNFLKNYYKALTCKYENEIGDRAIIRLYNKNLKERTDIRYYVLKKIIEKSDSETYYINELANIYIDRKDFENARKYIKKSKIINFNQGILFFLEAKMDFKREKYEFAADKLIKYLKKEKNLGALKLLAYSEYMIDNNYSAIKYYKEIVKLDKYDEDALYKLKELYKRVGNNKALIDVKYKIKFFYRNFYK